MKIRKILSAIIAAAVMTAVPLSANAAEGDATFCFDNNNAFSNWQTYGAIEQTGFEWLGTFGDFGFSEPIENTERWYIAARAKK